VSTDAPLSTKLPERAWELSAQEQNAFNENFIRELIMERQRLSGLLGTRREVGQTSELGGEK